MDQYNKMPPAVQEVFDSLVGDRMLFGSRSMASRWASETFNPASKIGCMITVDTDWDIAAEFNKENIVALHNAGFASRNGDELYAKDNLTQVIFTKNIAVGSGDIFDQIVPIHVILRKNNSFFMTVWDNIDAEYYYNYLWKRGPKFYKFLTKRYMHHRDAVKKEIRDAMNQLYASAEFNELSN
jgi:hypothetical protein